MAWIWEHESWPNFTWNNKLLDHILQKARFAQGKLLGVTMAIAPDAETRLSEQILVDEIMTTSAIEGETLNRDSVRSSIDRRLNLSQAGLSHPTDRYVDGLLEVLLDATGYIDKKLTLERLCNWQAGLFPTGYSGIKKINVGELRGEGDMQIISGRPGKTTVHYVAPPAVDVQKELEQFLFWFNGAKVDGLIRAGLAHLWFELIHPFDDGNGRIGRAIIDMALAQDEKSPVRYYSLSKQILSKRKAYYEILNQSNHGGLDVTSWLTWFIGCFEAAIDDTLDQITMITQKARFWQVHYNTALTERQKKALNKMLDCGEEGFEGRMTNQKYINITRASRATAFRELKDLVEKNCLIPLKKGGRNAAYQIKWVT